MAAERNGRDVKQQGFTLLEVLVAFVILAMMLGVIMNLNSLALNTTARASDREQALLLAQSQLDRVLASRELKPGTQSGRFDDDRFQWELQVSRFEFPNRPVTEALNAPEPYEIELSVRWAQNNRQGQSLTLRTLRLVRNQ